jgi:hypothetical protein
MHGSLNSSFDLQATMVEFNGSGSGGGNGNDAIVGSEGESKFGQSFPCF